MGLEGAWGVGLGGALGHGGGVGVGGRGGVGVMRSVVNYATRVIRLEVLDVARVQITIIINS